MSTDLFRALSNQQASADLSSYSNSLGHVPEKEAEEYKEKVEEAEKANELQDTLVDAAAAPFVEHGVGGGVTQIVSKIKGRLSAKAQQLAKKALIDRGVDEDLADRLVKGKIKPSELYEQMKQRGGEKFENLRNQFGRQVEDAAGRADGALNDARQQVQGAADRAAQTAQDAADQAQRAGNAAADQLADQAGDIADAAQHRTLTSFDNPLFEAPVQAQGVPAAAAPAPAPGDAFPGGAQLRTDHEAFQAARDAHDAESNRLADKANDAIKAYEDSRDAVDEASDVVRNLPDEGPGSELSRMFTATANLNTARQEQTQRLQELQDAHDELNAHNAARPQEANYQVAEDIDPTQNAANRAANAAQNQDVNPGQDVDGHGDEGDGANHRRTTGDDENPADPDDPTAPAGETAGADATADETIAGVSDAVDVAAAGEGFLDPLADFAALAVGLGLMGGISAAKKQMPKAPTPNIAINPAGGIGL